MALASGVVPSRVVHAPVASDPDNRIAQIWPSG